jgi:hypothetical protein
MDPFSLQKGLEAIVARDKNARFEPNVFCSVCQKMIRESKWFSGYVLEKGEHFKEKLPYHKTWVDVGLSILEGCHLCTLINFECLERSIRNGTQQCAASDTLVLELKAHSMSFVAFLKTVGGMGFDLFLYPPSANALEVQAQTCCEAGFLDLYSGSHRSLQLARHWLDSCLNHHRCSENISTSRSFRVPTRLLDVGTISSPACYLHLTYPDMKSNSTLKYLTLSHCWGTSNMARLTKRNLAELVQRISVEELPLTFQHAIIVTRNLGYRYLWIDSLCIVQDSTDDWKMESAIMGDIYSGCDCSISAMASRDGSGGLFVAQNPLRHLTCTIRDERTQSFYHTFAKQPGYSDLADEPLSSRGWVLQEQVMAPRTIHFTSNGLQWECLGDINWKASSYRRPLLLKNSPKKLFADLDCSQIPREILEKTRLQLPIWKSKNQEFFETFYHSWTTLVKLYSRRNLTKGTDKLVAFHGVTSKISAQTGLTPIAGLWGECLLTELLWIVGSVLEPSKRPAYRAPSWSWASIDTGVKTAYWMYLRSDAITTKPLNHLAEVKDVKISASPNGEVSSGSLQLSGFLRHISKNWQSWDTYFSPHDYLSTRRLDCTDDIAESTNLYALLVAERDSTYRGRQCTNHYGLLLAEVSGQNNVFRRVGMFHESGWVTSDFTFGLEITDEVATITIV